MSQFKGSQEAFSLPQEGLSFCSVQASGDGGEPPTLWGTVGLTQSTDSGVSFTQKYPQAPQSHA